MVFRWMGFCLGLVLILNGCATTARPSHDIADISKIGSQYNISAPIPDFTDFLLVETQLGRVEPRIVSLGQMADDLSNFDVVFFGEAHGHIANHIAQSKLFSTLYSKNKDMALSMEQFERSHQGVLNDYLDGKIGEETLIYEAKAWPHYQQSYRPLMEFAKRHKLAVVAAEVPADLVSCIGERGPQFLEQLKGEPRDWIADKLHLGEGAYKNKFYGFLRHAAGHGVHNTNESPKKIEQKKFYRFAAQVSRDDTMAQSIFTHLQAHKGQKVMHITGSFHSAGLLGTPERLTIRNPNLKLANIHPILVDDPEHPSFDEKDLKQGQYLLLISPTPKRFVQMKNINAFIKRTKHKIDEKRCRY